MTKGRQQLEKCLLGKRFLLRWIKKNEIGGILEWRHSHLIRLVGEIPHFYLMPVGDMSGWLEEQVEIQREFLLEAREPEN